MGYATPQSSTKTWLYTVAGESCSRRATTTAPQRSSLRSRKASVRAKQPWRAFRRRAAGAGAREIQGELIFKNLVKFDG